MAFCPSCGAEVDEDARFCASCGHRLKPAGLSPDTFERDLTPHEIHKTATRARAARAALGIVAVLAVIGALVTWFSDEPLTADNISTEGGRAGLEFGRSVAQTAAVVLWLMWQHRAQSNLRLRRPDARYSPGWAVGWWFIPFANFVMPYRTMRELWQGSTSDGPLREPSPRVSVWWVAFLASGALGTAAGVLALSEDPADVARASVYEGAGDLVSAVAALLAMMLVNGITYGQLALRSSLEDGGLR